MDKIKKNLNTIGLALFFAALVAWRVWPQLRAVRLSLAVLGAAAVVVYLVLNLAQLKAGMKRRSFLYSSNMLLVVVLVLAILVVLNVFLARHHQRFDFTQAKVHSLSDQSIQVVKALKADVSVKAFFREGNMGRAAMEDLLKIYAYHSPRLKYEFIDPDKNPGLVKRYEVAQDGTTVLEAGDKDTRITATTEEDVTNALVKITREGKKVVYFLEGHGEHSAEVTEESGYSYAKDDLTKLGYEVKKLTLALAASFPSDCALLVIPGPQKDLLPDELETITKYLEGGGRAFFLVDPDSAPNLVPFLAKFGFKLESDIVVDTVSRLMGGDYFMPLISEFESHEITRNFRYAMFFPFARTVSLIDPKPETVAASQSLGRTSANSYAKRDFKLKARMTLKEIGFEDKKDKAGPLSIAAVAALKPKAEGASAAPAKEGRLAVLGDSDFASNRYGNMSGNSNFFLNIANWLTEEADLVSIQPKTQNPRSIQLTPAQGKLIFWVSVVILPLLVLVLGLSIWFRRRAL
jgi:ABC-type uncharacterized transport system involved in gliding motility auxiliary subunit